MPLISHPNLIVGLEHGEDAGVYRLRDDLAIIQTVDFFTPVVDEPYLFGQIAVANALSDVYAMGGKPLTALNIVCFPINEMPLSVLREMLAGGLEKMREADVLLVGGHSVDDREIKYGLAVTGVVHPEKVLFNQGAKSGDKLILTKPLGTGIINTAIKAEMVSDEAKEAAINTMKTLNKYAADCVLQVTGVHACTDVTGFGLLGHLYEMIEGSGLSAIIDSKEVPLLPDLQALIETGLVPGGLHRNKDFRLPQVEVKPTCPAWKLEAFFDPQTSGGLLVAVAADKADDLINLLHNAGVNQASVIGQISAAEGEKMVVQ